jgi:hypothetical protein
MKIPKLYFQYAYPLDQNRRLLFEEKSFGEYPSIKTVREATEHFANLWEILNKNNKVMRMFTELIGTTLPRDVTCFVIGAGLNPISVPLLMPVRTRDKRMRTDDEFSEVIIHELAHSFVSGVETQPYWTMVQEKYGSESTPTKNHVIVFALLEKMLPNFFKKEKVNELLGQEDPDYQRALDIARAENPQKLIEEFRSYTDKITKL